MLSEIIKECKHDMTKNGLKFSVLNHYIDVSETLRDNVRLDVLPKVFSEMFGKEYGESYNEYALYGEDIFPITLNDGSKYIIRPRDYKKQEDMNITQSLLFEKLNLIYPELLPIESYEGKREMLMSDMTKGNIKDPFLIEFLNNNPCVILEGDHLFWRTYDHLQESLLEYFAKHLDIFCAFLKETMSKATKNEEYFSTEGEKNIPHAIFTKENEWIINGFTDKAVVNFAKARLARMSTFDSVNDLTASAFFFDMNNFISDVVGLSGGYNNYDSKIKLSNIWYETEFSKHPTKLKTAVKRIKENEILKEVFSYRERASFSEELNNVDIKALAEEYENKTNYHINKNYIEAVKENKSEVSELLMQ